MFLLNHLKSQTTEKKGSIRKNTRKILRFQSSLADKEKIKEKEQNGNVEIVNK